MQLGPECQAYPLVRHSARAQSAPAQGGLALGGKIPQVFAAKAEFLGVESQVVCITQHFFEQDASTVDFAAERERLDVPKRARRKSILVAWKRSCICPGIADTFRMITVRSALPAIGMKSVISAMPSGARNISKRFSS
jgi:hypothetical protein